MSDEQDEARMIALASAEADEWQRREYAAEAAREQVEDDERACRALDELARLVAVYEQSGDEVDLDDLRGVLRMAGHRDYIDENRGWPGARLWE